GGGAEGGVFGNGFHALVPAVRSSIGLPPERAGQDGGLFGASTPAKQRLDPGDEALFQPIALLLIGGEAFGIVAKHGAVEAFMRPPARLRVVNIGRCTTEIG